MSREVIGQWLKPAANQLSCQEHQGADARNPWLPGEWFFSDRGGVAAGYSANCHITAAGC
ncbi:MAG: hypothetical protein VX768_06545 [Planctomycetota bacterium]|nr:hypothetical protein [Planctomycetota bacterium]